jgi:hypothetical protein
MVDAAGLTVTIVAAAQPRYEVYVMANVPADTPETTPVDDPTVAIESAVVLQVPPALVFVNVAVAPTQTDVAPPKVTGDAFTVITCVVEQPVPSV